MVTAAALLAFAPRIHPMQSLRHAAVATSILIASCSSAPSTHRDPTAPEEAAPASAAASAEEREFLLERVDDVAIVQLYADGFERLTPRDRILCWHLAQAAIAGRPIYMQQRCADGLDILALCEEILVHEDGVEPATLAEVRRYTKLFWVDNSPYNNVTARKNVMNASPSELVRAAEAAQAAGAKLPLRERETARDLVARLAPMLFDPGHEPMVTAKSPEGGLDVVEASSATFYGPGVRVRDLEAFEPRYALNSNVVKGPDGELVEQPWRMGAPELGIPPGLYAAEIAEVVGHLEAALPFAPAATRAALEAQIRFYRTGAREDRVAYDIAWVADVDSPVDTVNSFVEVYVDPLGKKGSWEAIVSYEDPKKAALIKTIAEHAQWFEDRMPYDAAYRKPEVKGISARSIDVVIETGDSGPVTPIGINLPNDSKVREEHGSKSVSLANVVEAYDRSTPKGARAEFCWDEAELARAERWQSLTSDLLTNMHEVIGHASGRQAAGAPSDPSEVLGDTYSTLEEARADLVALYFMADPKLRELGLLEDVEEGALAAYEQYVRNGGLQQLRRVKVGDKLEEDHMRNRQLVVRWIQRHSGAIEERSRDGKRFLAVADAQAFRRAAGELLALVQEIKSTCDLARAGALIDEYGVTFDPALRDEVVARYAAHDVASYTGFVMPRLTPVRDARGEIVDVAISYPRSIEQQMLEWSGRRAPPPR
jgi:dipeptidyl-peptidase-3